MQWHSLLLLYTTMDEKARETRMKSHGKNKTGGHRPNKKGGEAATSTLNPEPNESKVKRTNPRSDWEPYLIYLSYHSHPIRPCGAPSPRGEGCDTRIPSSKKRRRYRQQVRPSALAYRHPERSRGIFLALPPYAHMHPHSNDTLVLPFSPFPRSRFTSLQQRSLHFGRDDV